MLDLTVDGEAAVDQHVLDLLGAGEVVAGEAVADQLWDGLVLDLVVVGEAVADQLLD